jgi:hypothetical protein
MFGGGGDIDMFLSRLRVGNSLAQHSKSSPCLAPAKRRPGAATRVSLNPLNEGTWDDLVHSHKPPPPPAPPSLNAACSYAFFCFLLSGQPNKHKHHLKPAHCDPRSQTLRAYMPMQIHRSAHY